MTRELKPCGTRAAYMRHLRAGLRGSDIDLACRLANSSNSSANRRPQDAVYSAAMWRARKALAEMYPEDYRRLMDYYTREVRKERDAS